jgi:hypothetical protein
MVKRFFQTLQSALYSPPFYKEQLTKPLGGAFRFYFVFLVGISLLHVLLTLPVFLGLQTGFKQTISQFVSSYPQELDVKVKNGTVSTTAHEPYIVALPPSDTSANQPKNAFVIDTKTPYSSKQFQTYDVLAWVTKDTVYYQDGEKQIKSFDLHQISNLHVNREIITDIWQKAQPYMVWVGPGLAFIVFIGLLLGGVFRLVYLLILAAIVILLGKITKQQLLFKQSYAVLLYAVTLPLIITAVLSILGAFNLFHGIAFSFTLLTLLSVIVNLFATPAQKRENNQLL